MLVETLSLLLFPSLCLRPDLWALIRWRSGMLIEFHRINGPHLLGQDNNAASMWPSLTSTVTCFPSCPGVSRDCGRHWVTFSPAEFKSLFCTSFFAHNTVRGGETCYRGDNRGSATRASWLQREEARSRGVSEAEIGAACWSLEITAG